MKNICGLLTGIILSVVGANSFADPGQIVQPLAGQIVKILQSEKINPTRMVDFSSVIVTDVNCHYTVGVDNSSVCTLVADKNSQHQLSGLAADLLIDDLTNDGVRTHGVYAANDTIISLHVDTLSCSAGMVTHFAYVCTIPE